MTVCIPLGTKNHEPHAQHAYYLEIIDGPQQPIYVHVWQQVQSNGHIQAAVSYQPLSEAVGQPFHDEAWSLYSASLIRV